ncbi:MAG: cytochrome C oxidase subunit IV family protein [Paracoccus sp. (in: a-proteobacteria)]|nr:cytochrome C oxidase subunit IV family protein [Paracoccus sp. (in: a-proteobacteria)]
MTRDPLIRAWLWLLAASAGSTLMAALADGGAARVAMLAVLVLAWIKARVVLGAYLELDHVPGVRRGFDLALGLFMVVAGGLYLAAG